MSCFLVDAGRLGIGFTRIAAESELWRGNVGAFNLGVGLAAIVLDGGANTLGCVADGEGGEGKNERATRRNSGAHGASDESRTPMMRVIVF